VRNHGIDPARKSTPATLSHALHHHLSTYMKHNIIVQHLHDSGY